MKILKSVASKSFTIPLFKIKGSVGLVMLITGVSYLAPKVINTTKKLTSANGRAQLKASILATPNRVKAYLS